MRYSDTRAFKRAEERNFRKLIKDAETHKWARYLLEQEGHCDIIRGQDDGEWKELKKDTYRPKFSPEYEALTEEEREELAVANNVF